MYLKSFTGMPTVFQAKKTNFFNYLLKKDIHIAALSETFLKNGTRFSHPNYHTYRLDRTQGEKGGVALVISKAINHEVNRDYKLKVLEAIGITIKTQNSKVTIISIYNPGSNNDHSSFRKDITKLSKISNHFIICGDFNARHRFWNCSKSNQMGKTLFEENQRGKFSIVHPEEHTHYPNDPNRLPSTIDLLLTNKPEKICNILTIQKFTSDHLPVYFEYNIGLIQNKHISGIPNYSEANWTLFKEILNNRLNTNNLNLQNINTSNQIDQMIKYFSKLINYAHTKSVPFIIPDKFKIILPPNILQKIKHRNATRKQWQKDRNNTILKTT